MAGPQQQVNVKIQRAPFAPRAKQKSMGSLQQQIAPMHFENRIGQTNHYLTGGVAETTPFIRHWIYGPKSRTPERARETCCFPTLRVNRYLVVDYNNSKPQIAR